MRYQIVMTKADMSEQLDLARRYTLVQEELARNRYFVAPILPCSASDHSGEFIHKENACVRVRACVCACGCLYVACSCGYWLVHSVSCLFLVFE